LSSVVEQPQTTKKRGGRQPGRALRYAKGSARGLLHHPVGHYPAPGRISGKIWCMAPAWRGPHISWLFCPIYQEKALARALGMTTVQPGAAISGDMRRSW